MVVKHESLKSSVIDLSCQYLVLVPGRWLDFAAWSLWGLYVLWWEAYVRRVAAHRNQKELPLEQDLLRVAMLF